MLRYYALPAAGATVLFTRLENKSTAVARNVLQQTGGSCSRERVRRPVAGGFALTTAA
jgi:hypothetical protein